MADIEKSKPEFVSRDGMIASAEYVEWLSTLKQRYRQSQIKAVVRINQSMLEFYWSLGHVKSGISFILRQLQKCTNLVPNYCSNLLQNYHS